MKTLGKLVIFVMILALPQAGFAAGLTCWFPPSWKAKPDQARQIAKTLSADSGLQIRPRIAQSYPQILDAFSSDASSLVYVGSFVQAIIYARKLGTPLAQSINGKEFYSGVMVYPKGEDPNAILKNSPTRFAYAIGASSGESSAKAATGGQAAIGVPNHAAACGAVKAGKAKAAVVKNWWWQANDGKFPELAMYELPGVSITKNPDNVLTASNAVSAENREMIRKAAMNNPTVFGGKEMTEFDATSLLFSLQLMKKGNIDPLSYTW
ncbi:MAG: hypothetical protein C0616_04850 [Desulfuromonas sp.]|nr:MAG: hypothetical protein C0616_04850 [Desulfuromonas sp.]